jgi:hypothetical protein
MHELLQIWNYNSISYWMQLLLAVPSHIPPNRLMCPSFSGHDCWWLEAHIPCFSRDLPSVDGNHSTWETRLLPAMPTAVWSQSLTGVAVQKSRPLASRRDLFCGHFCFRASHRIKPKLHSSWTHPYLGPFSASSSFLSSLLLSTLPL